METNTPQTGQVNVSSLTSAAQETILFVNLSQTLYGISPAELEILEEGASAIWKDFTLAGLGIGVPCLINAIVQNAKSETFNSEIFWNALVVGVSLLMAIIFTVIWYKSKDKCKQLIKSIKQRPQYKM